MPQLVAGSVNVYAGYSSEPAPMGIADFGVGASGPYQYSTTAFLGTVDLVSLTTRNATGDPWMGFQLNVVLVFRNGATLHAYWIQDVAQIDTSQNQIWFIDNIWNMTTPTAGMSGTAVSGNGLVDTFNGTGFYYDAPLGGPGNGVNLAYPATVSFLVTTYLNSAGKPEVTFQYDDGSGFFTYDTVTFVKANDVTTFTGFEVNGNSYNPLGLFYNAELVMGGPGGGQEVRDVQSDVRLGLYYMNGHNYQAVPSTYDFGGNTAESISNVLSSFFYFTDTGALIAKVQAGPGSLGPLYRQNQIGTMDIQTSISSGTLYVSNATSTGATPYQTPFTGGRVTVSVYPGKYLLQVYLGGAVQDSGTATVGAGQTLSLQTPLGPVQVTASYSTVGGSTGFSSPVLTYMRGGVQQTSSLTSAPTVYYLDPGTTWTVTSSPPAGSERWQTDQQTSGTATAYQTLQFVYYHQLMMTFDYAVVGGGTGYSAPALQYQQFGATVTGTANASVWADSGSPFSYAGSLPGSTSTERWEAAAAGGSADNPGTLTALYYHQYRLVFSYSVAGGGSPAAPSIQGVQLGNPSVDAVASTSSALFLDAGSTWSVQGILGGSTSQERWAAASATSGTVGAPSTAALGYVHQYYVTTETSTSDGGAVANLTGWHDQGASLQLTATANGGWQFEAWVGSGASSYSGASASTTLTVGSPLTETATFYPGLSVAAGDNGAVSYSFNGSAGTVKAGTSTTVYAPAGTTVTLEASPSSFLYSFSGWSGGASGASGSTTLALATPVSVTAGFAVNFLVVGGIAGIALVVVLAAAFLMRSRRRSAA